MVTPELGFSYENISLPYSSFHFEILPYSLSKSSQNQTLNTTKEIRVHRYDTLIHKKTDLKSNEQLLDHVLSKILQINFIN